MRCPKCGYISFDHVDACLSCNKELSNVSSALEGTTYNVAPPAFLKFTKRDTEQSVEEDEGIAFDTDQDDFGVVDPDLDVLVDDDSEEGSISFGEDLDDFDAFGEEESFEVAAAEADDDDGGIDLGQFEDAFEDEDQGSSDEDLDIEIPDELSDISDLSAPAQEESEPALAASAEEDKDEFGDFNLDLDMDALNDDFSLTEDTEGDAEPLEDDALGELSLDDLGLSETEEEEKVETEATKAPKKDAMDMDADLDFDLDLGGISLDDED